MSLSYQRKDSVNHLEGQELTENTHVIYKQPNRRKCYWNIVTTSNWECLKGHLYPQCSPGCADYLSVAQAARTIRERKKAQWNRHLARLIAQEQADKANI